ncbi:unnamed protein product [Cylindrotheca closterium]|uniref:DUF6824 domain-containing protein n=1 Tax=Cylindrotheca closterium TaxID=2856 RepID=A0AAD2GDJ9_9STRA|nr:unnamed protein product [Cylindrotheca closterium]
MSINDREIIGDTPDFSALAAEDGNAIIKDLTSRVNSISVQEREAGLHDIHGIGGIDDKSTGEEQVLVNKMRLLLSERLHWRSSSAFRMADAESSAYTTDSSFLLMFLRCENYNIDAATNRLFVFFKQKLRLFGPDKIGKKMITLADLSPDDMKSYSAGFFQLLPHRDHVGRAQFVNLPHYTTWDQRENVVSRFVVEWTGSGRTADSYSIVGAHSKLRMIFHLCMAALMDEETQKKGAITVVHSLFSESSEPRNPKGYDPVLIWESSQLLQKAIPLRFVGTHICTDPSSFSGKFFSSMARFVGDAGIVHIRFHQVSFHEVNERLSTFGINSVLLVVSQSGEKKTEKHRELMKVIKSIEVAKLLTPEKLTVLVPSATDVLLGRGKPIQNHPGNIRLGLIAESQLEEYDEIANRLDKTKLAEMTMAKMKDAGVRFLSRDDNGFWELAAERLARERVSSTFRTVRDRLKVSRRSTKAPSPADSTVARKRSLETLEE